MSSTRLCSIVYENTAVADGQSLVCSGGAYETEWFAYFECVDAGTIESADAINNSCSTSWQQVTFSAGAGGTPDTGSFDPSTLDPGLMAAFLGSGFFILLPLWAASWGVKALLQSVKMR